MSIAAGTRLGPYEILAPLGAGGMGEVWRARDTRLDRTVALKVLPADFANDTDRLKRFEQEARATSALNHPNILTVHDFGSHQGAPYLVAELLEGEELRAQLNEGALSVRKAIEYAQQIAAGLAAAHEKGIVHRDLKPENLFVTKDGRVKILDFGLAKLKPQKLVGGVDSEAATLKPLTNPGVVMGTVGYMSPEQVRGQETDQRSDIFSFGMILYEMLSGKRAFSGVSLADVMSAILKEDPPELSTMNAKIPLAMDKLVRRCLEKRPEQRFHSAHDLGYALEAVAAPSSSGFEQTNVVRALETTTLAKPGGWRARIWVIATGMLALVLLTLVLAWFNRAQPAALTVRFTLLSPEKTRFAEPSFALSPDGRQLAFCATDATEKTLLYLRPLNSFSAQPLAGTEGAVLPFWSPDSRSIAFFSAGKLKRIEVSGGAPQTLCDVSNAGGGAWNQAGEIIMAPINGGPLYRVPATGGVPTVLTKVDPSRFSHWLPQFLPGDQHFLFYAIGKQAGQSGIYVGSLSDQVTQQVLSTDQGAVYAAGYLLFVRNGALMGQPFDTSRLKLVGEPFLIAEQVKTTSIVPRVSAAENGTLVFQSGGIQLPQLVWFDRSGKQLGTIGETADYSNPSLTQDGKRLAVGVRDPQTEKRDIWLFDLGRGAKSRFTFDPADDLNSVWSKDGSQIFFSSDRKGQRDIFQKKVNAAQDEEVLYTSPEIKNVCDLSPDGRLLLYNTNQGTNNSNDLWLLPLEGERTPKPFLKTQFIEDQAVISPDGRWVAYRSSESGRDEIYVATFPQLSGKWQVSVDGGAEPQWRRDGNELFFTDAGRKLMAAEVKTGSGGFETTVPKLLFETPLTAPGRNRFVVSSDGQRFLVITRLEDTLAPINVVVNWLAEVKK
jgi:eukaryotic-like serine/threonine-protein kinase